MTIDEDAAKVVDEIDQLARNFDEYEFGLSITPEERQKYVALIAAYGRRCAEQMREECAKAVCTYCGSGRLVKTGTYLYNAGDLGKVKTEGDYHHCVSHDGKFEWDVPCKAEAIQRVEVK